MGPVHPPRRFDFSWADWRFAVRACLAPPPWAEAGEQLQRRWSARGDALTFLSVRSAFDLFLRVAGAEWRRGDEIVFTALTIPAMPAIARRHGFRPVALDVDPLTTAWDAGALTARIGPRTRAVVVAHLFGARVDLRATFAVTQPRGLAVIEDCAQAYVGDGWRGHEAADISLFSFGPLKPATAFGGALARVRNAATRREMRALLRVCPVQPTAEYLRRVLRFGLLNVASTPRLYGAIVAAAERLGVSLAQWVDAATRSMPRDVGNQQLRRRPCAALLALLARRLDSASGIDEGETFLRRRRTAARALLDALGPQTPVAARDAAPHGYWMIPVLTANGAPLRAALRAAGFDALPSRLAPVADGVHATPGADALAQAVCVPFDPRMTARDLALLGALAAKASGHGGP